MKRFSNFIKHPTAFSILLLFVLSPLVIVMTTTPGWGQTLSPQLRTILEQPPQHANDPEAVILLRERQMTIESDGLSRETIHIIGQIFDDHVKKDYRQIIVPFNSYFEDARLTFARTVSLHARTIEVSPDAVQYKTDPTEEGYSDTRWLTFSLRGLEVGSYFEYQVQITQKQVLIPGRWAGYFEFHYLKMGTPPRLDAVAQSRFILTIPEGEKFDYFLNRISISPSIHRQGEFVVYTWEARDLPSVPLENNMVPWSELTPDLSFSSIQSWQEVDAWGKARFLDTIDVTPDIQAKAVELTQGLDSPEKKVAALYHFIQTDIEYLFANLGSGGYTPHAPQDIFRSRYGDCKDQVTLLLAMLKVLNIAAYPALIRPAPYSQVVREIPSLSFPHLIAYIPHKNGDIWLDTTSSVTSFSHLPLVDQDRWAFVIDGQGGHFRKTPAAPPSINQGTLQMVFETNGPHLQAHLTLEGTGAINDRIKTGLSQASEKEQEARLLRFVKLLYRNARVQSVTLSNLHNAQDPFTGKAFLTLEKVWDPSKGTLTFTDDGLGALYFFTSYLRHLPSPHERQQDYVLQEPMQLVYEIIYLPPGNDFRVNTVPSNEVRDTAYLSFKKSFAQVNNSLQVRWELVVKEQRIPAHEYGGFYQSLEDVFKISPWQVEFSEKRDVR